MADSNGDRELLRRLARDAEDGARAVLGRYGSRIVRKLGSLSRDPELLESAFFDAVMKALEHAETLLERPSLDLEGWLLTCARHAVLDELRRRVVPTAEFVDPVSVHEPWLDVRAEEFERAVEECLELLSPKERVVAIAMYARDPRSTAELAADLGIDPDTVSTYRTRARKRLEECLRRKGWDVDRGGAS